MEDALGFNLKNRVENETSEIQEGQSVDWGGDMFGLC